LRLSVIMRIEPELDRDYTRNEIAWCDKISVYSKGG
jgi:hypothetical protein